MKSQTDRKYNHALSQVFSPALLKKIDDQDHEDSLRRLLHDSNIYPLSKKWNFVEGLELAYTYLKSNYRCEYVYKNEIANQLLLKFHNDNSATLLKEISSDSSIADIVIVNGSTVAYEIKTELDSFDRLSGQLASYQMLYDFTYIVTHRSAINAISKKVPTEVGIIILEENGFLKTVKEAVSCSKKFTPSKAVLTLRQTELVSAYEKYVGKMPSMGTSLIHSFCHTWFVNLNQYDAHLIFAEALKSRRPSKIQFELIKSCSSSLKMLFLSKSLTQKKCNMSMERLGIFV